MTRLRRHRAGLLALLCVAAGVLLVLLAFDARVWRGTVARDDLRFRALPPHRDLWQPRTRLPGDPASLLLGTGDTLAYRRALQLFLYSRIGVDPDARQDLPTLRAEAQQRLENLILDGPSRSERSFAANLLGVLVVTTPAAADDKGGVSQVLKRAAGYFRQAIRINGGNGDAKQNLEIVLRLKKPGNGRFGKDARAGYGHGRGHGATPIGGGY